ncbi:MAG TPA: hypothetical protein VG365_01495 [Solirubrobacteraceae bacterium]|nr:hypothetical protein [Solirubrobacteraceae bacterium]
MSASPLQEGPRLVQMAGAAELPVRLFGGVAIWERSGERMRATFGRAYADVDFVAHRRHSRALRDLLESDGYVPERTFNAMHGASRLLYHASDGSFHIDVFLDRFSMSHELDFADRLELEPLTLTAADLLLAKLQVAEINRKDLTDTAMLLLDHELGERDGTGQLNAAHVSGLCAADWGLFTTVGDNLDALDRLLPEFPLVDQETDALHARVSELRDRLEQAPKSGAWKLRAKLGRRKRWYQTPEEVVR